MLLKGSIGSCQKSVTVEPRYNKPLNDEVLGLTNDFLYPSDSEILLVCTWCHGGHVGSQEQKHFSPLGTWLYFHANSSKKFLLYWPPTWLPCDMVANQEYEKEAWYITKPCHSEHVLPVPWPFVWSKFHCIMLIRRLKRVVHIGTFQFLFPCPKMIRIWNLKFLSVFFEKLNPKGLFVVGTFKKFFWRVQILSDSLKNVSESP